MNTVFNIQFYQALLNQANDAIIATAMSGHLLFFNKSAQELFGFPDNIVKEEWLEYFELASIDSKIKIELKNHPVFRVIKDEKVVNEEMLLILKKKLPKEVLINANTILVNGIKEGIIVQFHDISLEKEKEKLSIRRSKSLMEGYEGLRRVEVQLKSNNNELEKRVFDRTQHLTRINKELQNQILTRIKGEEKLKFSNAELIKINKDLDDFVYTASHDLKTHIANIEGLTYALKDTDRCNIEDSNTFIELIQASLYKLKTTIEALSEISNTHKSENDIVEKIEFESVYLEIYSVLLDLIQTAGAKIIIDFTKCPFILFSKKNLKVIIFNLLSNSLKYRSFVRTPEILITTELLDNNCIFTISDNGIGFEENKKDKMFSMFTRLHNHVEGSGIGLYLVKRIAENAQGKIEVNSILNEGTTFRVFLPVVAE